jgi:predicted DNA binding CopG/RHH family protein
MKRSDKTPVKKFSKINEEIEYWNSTDSTNLVNWGNSKNAVFPDLKPTTQSISIRLPRALIEELKMLANKKDVPYQSLLKVYLSERVEKELHIA